MARAISERAQSGFSDAASYDAHRPSYPSASVENLMKALNVQGMKHARILEIAAGTGKFTSLLAGQKEEFEIVAVEPHADMRTVLQGKQLKGVKVVEGTAESLGAVEDGWADGVVVAQAFHWFANMNALSEIYRKLVPAGVLGLIWNIEEYNSPPDWQPTTKWEAKMKELTWSFYDEEPRFRHKRWKAVFDLFDEQLKSSPATIQSAEPMFSLPLGEHIEPWTIWLPSKEAVWDRYATISSIANLPAEERETTKKRVMELLEGDDVERNEKGEIALHGKTCAFWTTAIPGAPLRQDG